MDERTLDLYRELKRREADDYLRDFVPHKKQKEFIDAMLSRDYSEGWFIAANRAGKSEAGAYTGATLARFGLQNPKSLPHAGAAVQVKDRATSGWVVALDHSVSRDVIQPKYFDNGYGSPSQRAFIPKREIAHWREDTGILRLKNGSIMQFKSCESGAGKLQGADKDWIHFDEEPPKTHYDEATIRIGAGRKLLVFGTCTLLPPIGDKGGISWIFDQKIKPWREKKLIGVWMGGASIYDNPHLDPKEIERLEGVFPPDTPAGRIRLGGEWIPGVGGSIVYTNYASGIHLKDLGPPSTHYPLAWCWDFNYDPLITLIGQKVGDKLHVHSEHIVNSGGIEDMCDLVLGRYKNIAQDFWIYGDASGRQRRVRASSATGKTDYRVISNYLNSKGVSLRLRIPETNPYVNDRVNAMNSALRDADGQSRMYIDNSCHELIVDYEQVVWNTSGGIKKTTNPHDPYSQRTHSSDALGYWISQVAPLRAIRVGRKRGVIKEAHYGTNHSVNGRRSYRSNR